MQNGIVRRAVVMALLAQAAPVFAQTSIVDIRSLKPRQTASVVFTVSTAEDIQVNAVGAEADSNRGALGWITAMWDTNRQARKDPWIGNAWILDLATRRVVWELSAADTTHGAHATRLFDKPVRLAPGTYEAFYSAYPSMYVNDDRNDHEAARRFVNWVADAGFDDFRLTIRGNAHVLTGADADRARRQFENGAVVALHADSKEKYLETGFTLDRAADVDLYAVGELREDGDFDTAWLINADTRERLWKLTWRDSAPAGGAAKNRMAHITRHLPAGRYAAVYATDDSHDPSGWNAPPPHDPHDWGLLVRVNDPAARAAVKTFAYEHVPAAATIAAITRVGNKEARTRGFTLRHPMDVRVYALGEGRNGRMDDYGWIMSASGHQRVWEMRYSDTEPAGGDAKNRLFDRTIHLDKGNYIVHYVTDDSHSYGDWNAAAPPDGQRWGITVLAAGPALDRAAVADYTERPDPSIVAQSVRVGDDARTAKRFTLGASSELRVFALGESSGSEMADYGWIENARTGTRVWEMTYRMTELAGGASKNRRFNGTITLPAGDYVLHYDTDDSHAFGSWNADPPDEPEMWGITLYRVK
jgi:hypothetical protein